MLRASTAPGGRRTPLWQPRQNSITSDFGRQWNKPKWASKSRPCTPTEAASRRAFGRSEEPFTYNFEKRAKQREAQRAAEARKWGFQPPAAEGFVNPLAMARKRPNPDTVWRTRKLLAQTLDKRREQRERSVATSAFRHLPDRPQHATARRTSGTMNHDAMERTEGNGTWTLRVLSGPGAPGFNADRTQPMSPIEGYARQQILNARLKQRISRSNYESLQRTPPAPFSHANLTQSRR